MQHDTNNGHKETVRTFQVSAEVEFAAFDQLGPLTRQTLRDSPLPWLAYAIVKQIRDEEARLMAQMPEWQRSNFHLDLKNPQLDRNIANGILQQSAQVLLRDRSPEDTKLGMQPLRPRRTVRSDYRR